MLHSASSRPRCHIGLQIFSNGQVSHIIRRPVVCRASEGPIGEDVLARLRAAEEEAARLRRELETAQKGQASAATDVLDAKPKARIDSTDARESPFTAGKRTAWLSEKDVDFFTGGGPGETAIPVDPVMDATIQRRVIIGGVLSLAFTAFAFVPTEKLVSKPSKPMFFYLVPVLRVQDLLVDTKEVVADAQWGQLRTIIGRVKGAPNNARDNLDSVIALFDDARAAEKARYITADFFEYLDSMDYDKYFDTMSAKKTISGAQNAQFVEFSGKALKAAQQKLAAFIALCPPEAVDAARQQINAAYL